MRRFANWCDNDLLSAESGRIYAGEIQGDGFRRQTSYCFRAGVRRKILFPLQKDKEAVKVERELAKNRTNLIAAARNGDEEAMESLTMEDMDTYSMISQRIVTDDVLTIVDSYFMPYGIECDQYNVLGEILDIIEI